MITKHKTFAKLLVLLLCSGCTNSIVSSNEVPSSFSSTEYRLDTGDKIRINVFGQQEFNTNYSVDASGVVALPLIGAVSARGLTPRQFESAISLKLKTKYIREPNVTVEVETYRPFFILGEVTSAGQYSYVNGMSAQTAVAISGGFSPRAVQDKIEITRSVNGQLMTFIVPILTPVKPGDTLRVLERFI